MDRTTSARRGRQEAPGRGDQRGAHLPGAARLVADRAARRTIRDPSGGHADDAERRGLGAAHRAIVLTPWRPFHFVWKLLTSGAAEAPSSARPYPTSRTR